MYSVLRHKVCLLIPKALVSECAKQWHHSFVFLKELLGCDMEVRLVKSKTAAGGDYSCSAKMASNRIMAVTKWVA